MNNYKTPIARLARLFKKSRDQWKARAGMLQKKLRILKVTLRDTETSRSQWKQKAKTLKSENARLSKELASAKASTKKAQEERQAYIGEARLLETHAEAPRWHSYPTYLIYLGICQTLMALTGFRGAARSLAITAEVFNIPVPSHSSVRLWCYQLGYYVLHQPVPPREDRIFIIDIMVQLSDVKCLLILGVNQSHFESSDDYCLQHHDTEVLAMELMRHSSGEAIFTCLERLSARVGVPVQIVSDQGSDIKKGIEYFQKQHPEVIYTHDLTHKIALFVKPLLEADDCFQNFNADCNQAASQVQQTELNCLKPQIQRSKARYHHIGSRIQWAFKLLDYQDRGDFSLIDPRYCINPPALNTLIDEFGTPNWKRLCPLAGIVYETEADFDQAVSSTIGLELFQRHQASLHTLASLGRQRFDEKFKWVNYYRQPLQGWQQLVDLIHQAETQLKHKGLNQHSATEFQQAFDGVELTQPAQQLSRDLIAYMHHYRPQDSDRPETSRLVSSDIIESVFGQYKHLSSASSLQELGAMVLLLPLLVIDISADLVHQAMENVTVAKLNQWCVDTFGRSTLARRIEAFPHQNNDIIVA